MLILNLVRVSKDSQSVCVIWKEQTISLLSTRFIREYWRTCRGPPPAEMCFQLTLLLKDVLGSHVPYIFPRIFTCLHQIYHPNLVPITTPSNLLRIASDIDKKIPRGRSNNITGQKKAKK